MNKLPNKNSDKTRSTDGKSTYDIKHQIIKIFDSFYYFRK